MAPRTSLLAACIAHLLLGCGGDATHTRPGGAAGGLNAVAGDGPGGGSNGGSSNGGSSNGGSSNGGSSNGGSSNGGSSNGGAGGAIACCAAAPVCSAGERQAQGAECPGQPSCQQRTICCSSIWCVTDGGSGGAGGAGGSGAHDCNGTTCAATQACVAYRTVGGTRVPPDAGTCPSGSHVEGNNCQPDFAYKCADLHGACQNQALSCACAQPPNNDPGVCPVGFGFCSQPASAEVDESTQLVCQQLAP